MGLQKKERDTERVLSNQSNRKDLKKHFESLGITNHLEKQYMTSFD